MSNRGKLVIIEGNISAGKTTLASKMSRNMGAKVIMEPTATNPYLKDFYSNPKEIALKMQVWLHRQRYIHYVQSVRTALDEGRPVLLDRSVFSDWVFAEKNRRDGNISPSGFDFYSKLRGKMLQNLPKPHLVVYLDVDPIQCSQRIRMRNRGYESDIPLEYLSGLSECYEEFLTEMESEGTQVVRFNWNEFGDISQLSREIEERLNRMEVDPTWNSPNLDRFVRDRQKIAELCNITKKDLVGIPNSHDWMEDLDRLSSWTDIDMDQERINEREERREDERQRNVILSSLPKHHHQSESSNSPKEILAAV